MFDVVFMVTAFAGGVFGAAVGALPAFILCGVAAVVGGAISLATGDGSFSNLVAWGPFLGPHIAFAGGAAAAAYAAKRGKIETGRDIVTALMGLNSPDVLLVGGIFGALGYVLAWLFNLAPDIGDTVWTNTIALSIVVNAIIARLIFGETGVFGKVPQNYSRWLHTDKGAWLPYQSKPGQLIMIGLGVGIPAAYIALAYPSSVGLIFGFSAVALVFLQYGTAVPVTHHIALSAELVAAMTGNLWWGVVFAVAAAFFGEIAACVFTSYGDSHIDPPSVALVISYLLYAIFAASGVFTLSGNVIIVVAIVVAGAGYFLMKSLQKERRLAVSSATD
jgi:hypothetical protein